MSRSGGRSGPHVSGSDREGYLTLTTSGSKQGRKLLAVLTGHTLSLFTPPKGDDVTVKIEMENCDVRPPESSRLKKKNQFDVRLPDGSETYTFVAETLEEQQQWMSALMLAAVPSVWPSGICFQGTPEELAIVRKMPRLKEVPVYMRRALLLRKLLLCSVTFDFTKIALHTEEKDIKRQTLLELVDYCDTVKGAFNDASIFVDVIAMVSANIFRALPFKPDLPGDDDEEEEPYMEPAWPHLSIVYEFLLHLVQSQQIEIGYKKKGIDAKFVRRLLPLFESDDLRERDYLKTITHRIYGKLTHRRAAIRRAIANVFYHFIYEDGRSNGVAELLEILASIINGFATPIKEEHKKMLQRALIPLHKMPTILAYHPQLTYCMTLYASKETALLKPIVMGVLRAWPFGNSPKEMLLLNEVEELFDYMEERVLEDLVQPLFGRLAKCIESDHFQVAERALWLWNNQSLVNLVVDSDFRKTVLPLVFRGLYRNSIEHWHDSVKQLSQHVLALYMEADGDLYERCLDAYNNGVEQGGAK